MEGSNFTALIRPQTILPAEGDKHAHEVFLQRLGYRYVSLELSALSWTDSCFFLIVAWERKTLRAALRDTNQFFWFFPRLSHSYQRDGTIFALNEHDFFALVTLQLPSGKSENMLELSLLGNDVKLLQQQCASHALSVFPILEMHKVDIWAAKELWHDVQRSQAHAA